MTVLEFVRTWLENSGLMSEFTENNFDYLEGVPEKSGLFSNGTTLMREDIEGNQKYQASLTFMAGLHAFADYDRIKNGDFITRLTYSLNQIRGQEVTELINGEEKTGVITGVTGANGMLYSLPTGDINDGVIYQLQIRVDYTVLA